MKRRIRTNAGNFRAIRWRIRVIAVGLDHVVMVGMIRCFRMKTGQRRVLLHVTDRRRRRGFELGTGTRMRQRMRVSVIMRM